MRTYDATGTPPISDVPVSPGHANETWCYCPGNSYPLRRKYAWRTTHKITHTRYLTSRHRTTTNASGPLSGHEARVHATMCYRDRRAGPDSNAATHTPNRCSHPRDRPTRPSVYRYQGTFHVRRKSPETSPKIPNHTTECHPGHHTDELRPRRPLIPESKIHQHLTKLPGCKSRRQSPPCPNPASGTPGPNPKPTLDRQRNTCTVREENSPRATKLRKRRIHIRQ
jgi:hypothetical protein